MNTVLDDNKVLTLANGDRIFMLDSVKMVFEVENLNNASPATVSRCGQIYVSPSDLGAEQIMRGWIKQRTKEDVGKNTTTLISIKQTIEKYFNKEDGEKALNLLLKYFRDLNVVELFERTQVDNPCPFGTGWCGSGEPCPLHHDFVDMETRSRTFLEGTTFGVFVKPPTSE